MVHFEILPRSLYTIATVTVCNSKIFVILKLNLYVMYANIVVTYHDYDKH